MKPNLYYPALRPSTLKYFAEKGTPNDKKIIAQNPNTPLDLLAKLAVDYPEHVEKNTVLALFSLENPEPSSLFWKCKYYVLAGNFFKRISFLATNSLTREKTYRTLIFDEKSFVVQRKLRKSFQRKILGKPDIDDYLDWSCRVAIINPCYYNSTLRIEALLSLLASVDSKRSVSK